MKIKNLTVPFDIYNIYHNTNLDLDGNYNRTIAMINNDSIDDISNNPNDLMTLNSKSVDETFGVVPIVITTFRDNKITMSKDKIESVCRNHQLNKIQDSFFDSSNPYIGHHKDLNAMNPDTFLLTMNFVLNYTSDNIYVKDIHGIVKTIPPIHIKKANKASIERDNVVILTLHNLINPYKAKSDLNKDNYLKRLCSMYKDSTNELEKEIYKVADVIYRNAENLLIQNETLKNYGNSNIIDKNSSIIKVMTYGKINLAQELSNNEDSVYIANKYLVISKNPYITKLKHPMHNPVVFESSLMDSMKDFNKFCFIVDNFDKIKNEKYIYVVNKAIRIKKIKSNILKDGFYYSLNLDGLNEPLLSLEELNNCNYIFNSEEDALKPRDVELIKAEYELKLTNSRYELEDKKIKSEASKSDIEHELLRQKKELEEMKLKFENERIERDDYYSRRKMYRDDYYESMRFSRNDYIDSIKFSRDVIGEFLKLFTGVIAGGAAMYILIKKFGK